MTKEELYQLTTRFLQGTASEEEKAHLEEWYAKGTDEDIIIKIPSSSEYTSEAALKTGLLQHINDNIKAEKPAARLKPLLRMSLAAASVIFILATGAYIWLRGNIPETVAGNYRSAPAEILPGKNGAILTLADGSQIVLDSLGNGVIATQKGTRVVLKDGQVSYDPTGDKAEAITYNTMTTPKGRQFHVLLPDGTLVWLNAESSLEYPTLFSGKERRVKVSGEAYFEIAPNAAMPFRLLVDNRQQVEVLGTHFNVKAYKDENIVRTTLLQGSVRVRHGASRKLLQPGQQAQVNQNSPNIVVQNSDIESVMAWRNGLFNFEDAKLEEVMRQLSRWYDIKVVYEKGIPDIEFGGEIKRNIKLNDILTALESTGVHFRIEEGRTLVVLP